METNWLLCILYSQSGSEGSRKEKKITSKKLEVIVAQLI